MIPVLTRYNFSKEELHAGISSCGFDAEDLSEVFERCEKFFATPELELSVPM